MLKFYLKMLEVRPMLTMALSTGTLMATGDLIAQTAIEKRHRTHTYQPIRTVRFFAFGTIFGGPALRIWYANLDKIVPAATALRPVKMMVLDQAFFSPFFITVFWTTMGLLRGETIQEVKESLRENFIPVLISNYKLWPAAQLINFYVIPLQHRVLFANMVALGWNTYIAWKAEAASQTSISST